MHVLSYIANNGSYHIQDDWPDWEAIIDDMKTLRELGYVVFGTKLNFQLVMVVVNSPLRPIPA